MTDNMLGEMMDISAPTHGVQVDVRHDGKVLWVNVDGKCRLRVCDIPNIEVKDDRPNAT